MKRIFTLLPFQFLLCASLFAAETNFGTEYFGAKASAKVPGAKHIWVKQANALPAFIEFYNGSEPDEEGFFPWAKKIFHLDNEYGYTIIQREQDEIGFTHIRCRLTYKGVEVKDGNFILHSKNGRVQKMNGLFFNNLKPTNSASLSSSSALKNALNFIGANSYKWQFTSEEAQIKQATNNAAASYLPKGELVILQSTRDLASTDFRYAWKFDIYAQEPMSRDYVYVDAQNGEILRKESRIHTADAASTAATGYRGTQNIVSDSYNGSYRLRETGRGGGVRTFNLQKGTSLGAAVDFTNATTAWTGTNANKDQYARDAHFGGEKTYDFFKTSFNRNSIDNNGLQLNLYVHYSTSYLNAYWDGYEMIFGDGSTGYNPLTSLDITGHEISHGLTQYTASLDYQDESGALNEGFSDCFGTAIEYYATPAQSNWLIGEDIGGAFRSMSAPKTYQQPNTYQGTYWYTGTGDNGGVHTNSGVLNFWYYLMCQGGSGTNDKTNAYNVTAIGRTKTNAITYRTLTNYLINTSEYVDARFYALQSATDLYGGCSQEVTTTGNAWYAVGVGGIYTATVDAQFVQTNTTGCTVPFTVTFTNQSTNGNAYTWNFGDGTTSTATSPVHTYTAFGNYTVKLVASGGVCGNDSLVKTNLVSLSSSNPCVVIMPPFGAAQVQTACNGTVYDDGGPNAAYADNVTSTVTISPTGAAKVKLTFTKFRLESAYDYLYVYDGPNTASPLLGTYTGYTLPASVTSTAPSITIKEVTDPGVVDTGFAINWTCILATTPPTANFISSTTSTCSGIVKFTDKTTGGVTSWLWDFGDGTISTLQNPTKQYLTNGTFTVKLTATNGFGSNTKTSTGLITVTKPAGPTVVNASRCTAGSLSLSATTSSVVNWYANATDTVKLSSANPYNTPVISSTTNYYAEEIVGQTIVKVGAASNAIGAGSIFNGNSQRALRFKVIKPSRLVSVYVYAQGNGNRVIQYRDTFGTIIAQKNIFVPDGASRLTLNFDLVPSTTDIYELGVGDSMNMYRNTAGAVYPYNDSKGLVSIIGNNIPGGTTTGQAGYYYYFYDWEVQEPDCISLRSTATATVSNVLNASTSTTSVNCFGQSTGTATVTTSGAQPTVTYAWSNSQNAATAINLGANSYTVSVTDGNGCSTVKTVTVTQPASLPTAAVTPTAVSCFGGTNGSASATGSGGTAGYTFTWPGPVTGPSVSNLSNGNYTMTVTDSKNCTATKAFSIAQPAQINSTFTNTSATCGAATGSATALPTGGAGGYTYVWSGGGQITNPAINLSAGTYQVTIKDANNCTVVKSTTVNSLTSLSSQITPTSTKCFGDSSGSAAASITGGSPNYLYTWSNGVTTNSVSNLKAGIYYLTVKDASQCIKVDTVVIGQPTLINATFSSTNANCSAANGTATITPSGGAGGYSYVWSNSQTTNPAINLAAGSYQVTIIDASNCTVVKTITVNPNANLASSITPVNVKCFGGNDGTASVVVSGGSSNYQYDWSNGSNISSSTNLSAGKYYLTVKDGAFCQRIDSFIITQPTAITSLLQSQNNTCHSANNGRGKVVASGGTPGYTYLWTGGSTSDSAVGLAAGTYVVTVKDANLCEWRDSITITEPATLAVSTSSSDASNGQSNGIANASAFGGTPPYQFNWSNGDTTALVSNLAAGTYSVSIKDAQSCQTQTQVTVGTNTAISDISLSTVKVYPNPANDVIIIEANTDMLKAVSLTDLIGRTIEIPVEKIANGFILHTSSLASSVYELCIKSSSGTSCRKVVIER